jgi:hypothetical protein
MPITRGKKVAIVRKSKITCKKAKKVLKFRKII